jgi:hypothetical protein
MEIDKEEIAEELAHHKEMLRLNRRRLRELERKQAQQGINTPAEVITEIYDLTESIQRHRAEVAQLQTEAAVDKEPLAEVEYRALLAEVWDTPQGRPTVANVERLKLLRLHLGIASERAQELEHEIRVTLAAEAIANVDARYLPGLRAASEHSLYKSETNELRRYREATVRLIERAIRLDLDTALQSFMERLYYAISIFPVIEIGEVRSMLRAAKAWGTNDERWRIDRFIDTVEAMLEARHEAAMAEEIGPT